jgi:hypothetical protein
MSSLKYTLSLNEYRCLNPPQQQDTLQQKQLYVTNLATCKIVKVARETAVDLQASLILAAQRRCKI